MPSRLVASISVEESEVECGPLTRTGAVGACARPFPLLLAGGEELCASDGEGVGRTRKFQVPSGPTLSSPEVVVVRRRAESERAFVRSAEAGAGSDVPVPVPEPFPLPLPEAEESVAVELFSFI
jgi:hypothetical protein